MTSWLERAKVQFSQPIQEQAPKTPKSTRKNSEESQEQTPTTPKRGVMGVLGACSSGFLEKRDFLPEGGSSVLAVHLAPVCENADEDDPMLRALLQVAMRACDHWNDSPAAREQMRQDCLNTPPHLRAELLALFRKQYGSNKP